MRLGDVRVGVSRDWVQRMSAPPSGRAAGPSAFELEWRLTGVGGTPLNLWEVIQKERKTPW
jgi:hypothetical protein